MRWLLLLCLLFLPVTIYSQPSRTAAAIQTAPFSQLLSTLPNSTVRVCINCQSNASTGTCEVGASQMVATKLNGLWKCSNGAGGGGGGGVTSFNSRTGVVIPALSDYTFNLIGGVAQNKILGRGASSGTGVIQELTIGSGLLLTGTTLTGTGGGSGTAGKLPKWATSTTLNDSNIQDTGSALTLGVNSSVIGTLSTSGAISTLQSVTAGAASFFNFSGRSVITSSADGRLTLTDSAATGFTHLFFGTTSGPYLQISSGEFVLNSATGGGGTAQVTAGQFITGPSSTGTGGSGFKAVDVDGSVTIEAPENGGTPYTPWTLTLPLTNGNAGEFLRSTNGLGTTDWAVPAGAGDVVASGTLTSNKILKGGGSTTATASTVTITQPATSGSFIFGTDLADLTFQGDGTVVNRDSTDTLTNKSISGSTNTVTNLNTSVLTAGTIDTARLGSGTANNTTFLRGDQTWQSGIGDVNSNTATSVDSEFTLFSATGGKTIKRATGSGLAGSTAGVYSAVTTSAGVGGFISDETGSGLMVFQTSPTIILPTIGSFANANHSHANSAGGGQLTIAAFSSTTGTGAVVGATSPTLTTPTIGSFTNAQHLHTNAANGGQITDAALSSQVTVPKGGTGLTTVTTDALVKGNGASAMTVTGVTVDSSNNVSTAGSVSTGVGGSVAGNVAIGEGTATSVAADNVQIQGAAAITGYNIVLPDAAGDGFIRNVNTTNVVTQSFVNAEFVLSQTSGVDWNVTTKSTLYTVPAGKSAIITRVIVDNASTSLTTASCPFGFNANADDVKATATYTELTTAALNTVIAPKVGAATGAATNVFGTKCTITQGGAATVRITVFGILF